MMQNKNQTTAAHEPKGLKPMAGFKPNAAAASQIAALEPVDGAESAEGHIETPSAIENIIKDYRVIRTVSETSTSIVYKAEDIRTKRRVAIKLIYNRDLPDFDRISRARVEIERLRHLSHPGIAATLDAGTTKEGHCYIVSEFIKGVALNEYLSIHKLSLDDRLSMFARLCEAVHYGHQRCLIHRDLRPSNILIDGKCNPKIVGLGIAGVTDVDIGPPREDFAKREFREFLAYKSPEQVSGRLYDLDVRTDVYSLGVILYELLTDKLPYKCDSENGKEIVQAVLAEMPPKPSSIKASLRGDLEAIVLKAMEKQPSDRYQTVMSLSQDMENYFDARPVGARRAGAMYEFRKLAMRYKSRTISGIIMTMAVLAFGLHIHMTTRQAGHKRVAEVEQTAAGQIALERNARDIALAELKQAKDALEEVKSERESIQTRIAEAQGQLASVDSVQSELTERAETAEMRAKTYEATSRFWASLLNARKGDSAQWAGLPGLLNEAAERIGRDFADAPLARAMLSSEVAMLMTDVGEAKAAVALASDALTVRSEALGDDSEDSIETMNILASALFASGKPVEAEPVCRRLVAAASTKFGEEDARTLTAMNNLAMTLYPQQKFTEAEELLQQTLFGRRKALGDVDRRTAGTAQNLGMVLFDQMKYEAAADAFREALAVFEVKLSKSHVLTADTRSRLGACFAAMSKFEKAEPLLIKGYQGLLAKLGPNHPDVLVARQRVVDCYRSWGKSEKAEQFGKTADQDPAN
ncbi:MAG: tetratricopeptide repeat protein [Planctomycetes bacterium]|nr:tetratricopeptide repeat protein [Planctomycetota bacterium]